MQDLISRQAAIDEEEIARRIATILQNERDMRVIEENNIIHCKDCKFWYSLDGETGTCECERWDVEDCSFKMLTEEWHENYCSHAERRE